MCFYITKEFQSNPPEPVDPEVKIVKSKERVGFVKQFGGYAMQDSVWMKEAEKFRAELSAQTNLANLYKCQSDEKNFPGRSGETLSLINCRYS